MTQLRGTKQFHTFVGGLNTEVSPLIYPDHTAVDLSNMELNIDGSLSRRKGLEEEPSFVRMAVNETIGFDFAFAATSTHFWRNVNGTDENFQVAQIGHEVYFWTDDATSFAANERGFSLDLEDHIIALSGWDIQDVANEPIDFSWGRGQGLITHKMLEPFFVRYNPDTDSVVAIDVDIRVRDFIGVENGLQNSTLPTTLSDEHKYNLRNRGWTAAEIADFFANSGITNTPYPSTSMKPKGMRRREVDVLFADADGTEKLHAQRLAAQRISNGSAPQGKFTVNPFVTVTAAADEDSNDNPVTTWDHSGGGFAPGLTEISITTQDAHGFSPADIINWEGGVAEQQVSGIRKGLPFTRIRDKKFSGIYVCKAGTTGSTIIIDITINTRFDLFTDREKILGVIQSTLNNRDGDTAIVRPTTNAYFAGRAWYAGTPAGVIGQHILFSQIIEQNNQYGKCYQSNDPTDEDAPDLLESDGGVIYIPEAGRILKLQPFGMSMLVLSDNGVWEIDGGANRYFDAADFAVRRVTGTGVVSRESVIEAEDNIIYASEEGAFRIFTDPESRVIIAESITEGKVQSKWAAIPTTEKESMITVFDPVKKRLLFLYDNNPTGLVANPTRRTWVYREALIYDSRLDAWYVWDFNSFEDNAGYWIKGVTLPERYNTGGEANFKFLVYDGVGGNQGMSWFELTDDATFEDFGVQDAPAFIVTGYEAMGDHSKDKQVRYITTFMSRIENASLKLRGRWDFANADISGKWSPEVEAYKPPRVWVGAHDDDGYPVVVSKHTIPGQGQVLSLRYDTVPNEDAHLYGWTIDFQGIQD